MLSSAGHGRVGTVFILAGTLSSHLLASRDRRKVCVPKPEQKEREKEGEERDGWIIYQQELKELWPSRRLPSRTPAQ